MAQQVNLHAPILLKPTLLFSARAVAQALAVFIVAVVLGCSWTTMKMKAFKSASSVTENRYTEEQAHLQAALIAQPSSAKDLSALRQQWDGMQASIEALKQSLQDVNIGRDGDGRSYSAFLRMLADTAPASVWITDVKLAIGRLEVSGMCLNPDDLQAWAAKLSEHPLTGGRRLTAVRVERSPWQRGEGQGKAADRREAWAYTLVSSDHDDAVVHKAGLLNQPGAK